MERGSVMIGGFAGKVLRVNLSTGLITEENLDLSLAKSLVGSLGVAGVGAGGIGLGGVGVGVGLGEG